MTLVVDVVSTVTMVIALLAAAATGICVVRNRLPGWPTVIGLLVLEAALLVAVIVNIIALIRTELAVDGLALIGYLIVVVLIVPAGVLWAFVNRTRYGVAAIVIVCLAVPVMLIRTQQIWEFAHAG